MSSALETGSASSCCGLALNGEPARADFSPARTPGDSEVRDARRYSVGEQHGRWLEVAMYDAVRVNLARADCDTGQQRQQLLPRPAAHPPEITTGAVVEHGEYRVIRVMHVV